MEGITKILPRYAETDQMGIIHHSVYAVWYEQARTDYFNKIGMAYDEIEKTGLMTPLVYIPRIAPPSNTNPTFIISPYQTYGINLYFTFFLYSV